MGLRRARRRLPRQPRNAYLSELRPLIVKAPELLAGLLHERKIALLRTYADRETSDRAGASYINCTCEIFKEARR